MGQNKEQLKKLLDFIEVLAKDKDNAWFVKRLREQYGLRYDGKIDDIYEYSKEKDTINPHLVNPLYIKQIEALK